MTETCANCMWSRKVSPRIDLAQRHPGDNEPRWIDRILCNRMPQAVENDATYACGEYLRKKDAA